MVKDIQWKDSSFRKKGYKIADPVRGVTNAEMELEKVRERQSSADTKGWMTEISAGNVNKSQRLYAMPQEPNLPSEEWGDDEEV
jgi:hypothetical protein